MPKLHLETARQCENVKTPRVPPQQKGTYKHVGTNIGTCRLLCATTAMARRRGASAVAACAHTLCACIASNPSIGPDSHTCTSSSSSSSSSSCTSSACSPARCSRFLSLLCHESLKVQCRCHGASGPAPTATGDKGQYRTEQDARTGQETETDTDGRRRGKSITTPSRSFFALARDEI